jgi:hypothetical protein
VPEEKVIIHIEKYILICEGTGGQNGAMVKAAKMTMKNLGLDDTRPFGQMGVDFFSLPSYLHSLRSAVCTAHHQKMPYNWPIPRLAYSTINK